MIAPINFDEIQLVIDGISGGFDHDAMAVLNRVTGQMWLISEHADEPEPPDGWDTDERYVELPTRRDLGLGSETARRFVETHLPEHENTRRDIFSRQGAFRRWKSWLEQSGHLDAWYAFEARAEREAIEWWCAEQGLTLQTAR